ncbi:MAG: MFS transporter [Paludibacteraceae bacterium]|nr:MFS transporter [Paludibacteraceae bacterium]
MKNLKFRLIVMNFLEFAVWGSYLCCLGQFLGKVGWGEYISWFYIAQGVVSIFMPAIMGAVSDKFIQPQRLLGLSHLLAAAFMLVAGYVGYNASLSVVDGMQPMSIWTIFIPYCLSVAFFMPTIAISNTVAFDILKRNEMDTVKDFPPIRVFGTVGFIAAMWFVNFVKVGQDLAAQFTYMQLLICGAFGMLLGVYAFTLPECPLHKAEEGEQKTLAQRLGLDAFVLFKDKNMALFFIFCMLLGVSLQITNGYATSYINSFAAVSDSWFAQNPTMLISVSQICEACCILLIPFFMKRFGIKKVMLIAMVAWFLRFGLFGIGSTESVGGIICLFLSCIVYGVAFDFFNVSGALFVEKEAPAPMRGSAQGLFMLMTNGIGASVGTWIAGMIVSHFCEWSAEGYLVARDGVNGGWFATWGIFAMYALVVAIMFAILFKYKHEMEK